MGIWLGLDGYVCRMYMCTISYICILGKKGSAYSMLLRYFVQSSRVYVWY